MVKGAPEPVRDVFIYRVSKDTVTETLIKFVKGNKFNVINLSCVSNNDAKYKSFKLSIPVSEYDKILDDSMWPIGVRVRRYYAPKYDTTKNPNNS